MTTLKFYYNGIKASDGKLQRCHYSIGQLLNQPAGTISIYAREYAPFSQMVREQFHVKNDSHGQSDYFETDSIRVTPDHPLYADVLAAHEKADQHNAKQYARQMDRCRAYHAARAAS